MPSSCSCAPMLDCARCSMRSSKLLGPVPRCSTHDHVATCAGFRAPGHAERRECCAHAPGGHTRVRRDASAGRAGPCPSSHSHITTCARGLQYFVCGLLGRRPPPRVFTAVNGCRSERSARSSRRRLRCGGTTASPLTRSTIGASPAHHRATCARGAAAPSTSLASTGSALTKENKAVCKRQSNRISSGRGGN